MSPVQPSVRVISREREPLNPARPQPGNDEDSTPHRIPGASREAPGIPPTGYLGRFTTFAGVVPLSSPIATSRIAVPGLRSAPCPAANTETLFPNSGVITALKGNPPTNPSNT